MWDCCQGEFAKRTLPILTGYYSTGGASISELRQGSTGSRQRGAVRSALIVDRNDWKEDGNPRTYTSGRRSGRPEVAYALDQTGASVPAKITQANTVLAARLNTM
jgi:hypothetical protein